MSQFKILLCGDSPVYSNSLKMAFEENHLFKVIDNVPYEDLIESATRLQPEVVVLKIYNEEALSMVSNLTSACPTLLPIVIIKDPSRFDITYLLDIGVRGFLPSRLLPRQVVNAVELVVVAGLLCLPRINPGEFNNGTHQGSLQTSNPLTSREREILGLLGKSLGNKEIADTLCLSESTVKTHLRNTYRKLGVRNRSEAIALLFASERSQHNK